MINHLELVLFGPFQIFLDGKEIFGFKSQKVRALLAYLAVEIIRPHSREELAAILWPDYPEQEARNNLRFSLYNLRHVIRDQQSELPYLIVERDMIQFNPKLKDNIDVCRFTQLLSWRKGELPGPNDLLEAIRLYRSDFLEGFNLPDSLELDEWVTFKRAELRRMQVDALGKLADYYESCGDFSEALTYAWRQVEMEPWQEFGQRQLMRLLTYNSQPGTALAHYEQYQQQLQVELGVKPAKEITKNWL